MSSNGMSATETAQRYGKLTSCVNASTSVLHAQKPFPHTQLPISHQTSPHLDNQDTKPGENMSQVASVYSTPNAEEKSKHNVLCSQPTSEGNNLLAASESRIDEYRELSNQCDEHQTMIGGSPNQVGQLPKQLGALTPQQVPSNHVPDQQSTIDACQKHIQSLETYLVQETAQRTRIQYSLLETQKLYNSTVRDRDTISTKLASANDCIAILEAELKQWENNQAEIDTQRQREFAAQLTGEQTRVRELESQLNVVNDKLKLATQKLEAKQLQSDETEVELQLAYDVLKSELVQASIKSADAYDQIAKQKQDFVDGEKNRQQLKADLALVHQRVWDLESQLERGKEFEHGKEEDAKTIAALKAELEVLKNASLSLGHDCADDLNVKGFEERERRMQEELQSVQQQLAEATREIRQRDEAESKSREQFAHTQQELIAMTAEKTSLHNDLDKTKQQFELMQQQLQVSHQNELRQLQQQLEDTQKQQSDALNQLNQQLQAANLQYKNQEANQQQQLEEAHQQIQTLQQQLHQVTTNPTTQSPSPPEVEFYQRAILDQKRRVDELERELGALNDKFEAEARELSICHEKDQETQDRIKSAATGADILQHLLHFSNSKLVAQAKTIEEANAIIHKGQQQLEELLLQRHQLQQQYQQQYEELQRQLQDQKQQLQEDENHILEQRDELQKEYQAVLVQLDTMKVALASANSTKEEETNRLAFVNEKLQQENASLQAILKEQHQQQEHRQQQQSHKTFYNHNGHANAYSQYQNGYSHSSLHHSSSAKFGATHYPIFQQPVQQTMINTLLCLSCDCPNPSSATYCSRCRAPLDPKR